MTGRREVLTRRAWRRADPVLVGRMSVWLVFLLGAKEALGQALQPASMRSAPGLTLVEAVRQTLAQDPNIRLQRLQVDYAKGVSQNAAGQFDVVLDTAFSQGLTRTPLTEWERIEQGRANVAEAVEHVVSYRMEISKQFRSGITVSPGVEVTRFADNLDQERAANRASVSFIVTVPLLKGLGAAATDARERAARVSQEAAVLDLQQMIASRILNTVSAYWNCLAAQQQLQVLMKSQEQAEELVDGIGKLVKIGELPASEQLQAEADRADRTAARIVGEQRFWQTRQDLALALGLALEKMALPPEPADDFPDPDSNAPKSSVDLPSLLARSLERRADYLSSLKVEEATQILLTAARKDLKPQLDFNLEIGYAGLDEGSQFQHYYQSLDPRAVSGPNLLGTISLKWPFANQTARGLLAQRQAAQQQSVIRSQDLSRTIFSGILVAWSEWERSLAALKQTMVARQNYSQTVTNERDKLLLGTGTTLDIITLADRLNSAQLNEIAAKARYAIGLARVRFETGRLVQPGTTLDSPVSVEDLTSLPDWNWAITPKTQP